MERSLHLEIKHFYRSDRSHAAEWKILLAGISKLSYSIKSFCFLLHFCITPVGDKGG